MAGPEWAYSEKVKEHFMNPKNILLDEEGYEHDGKGVTGNIKCGDEMIVVIQVDIEKDVITDCKWKTFGCASAIASASVLTELLIGKTVEEAEAITNDHIAESLGGLPKEKMHCSVMGQEALEKAIACYRGQPDKKPEGNIVCECFGITDVQIERALTENSLKTIEDITNYIKAGGGCGNCHDQIQEIIDRVNGATAEKPPESKPLTNIQKISRL